jgi:hypothetical protein
MKFDVSATAKAELHYFLSRVTEMGSNAKFKD